MKVVFNDEFNYYIYLSKYNILNLDIDNKRDIEEYFKRIFLSLKNNYHLDIYGLFNIRVYCDKNYGIIIDVLKLNSDYFKITNKVEMKIVVDKDNSFLYEIDDYFFIKQYHNNISNIYCKNKKYYIELKDDIEELFYLYLLEHANIIFNDEALDIKYSGVKL